MFSPSPLFALAAGIMGIGKANQYQSNKSMYEQQRAAMVARLDALRQVQLQDGGLIIRVIVIDVCVWKII